MQKVKLPPGSMDTWLLLHDRGRTKIYRPSDEEIFLKPESQLKFTDEIFRVPASAIEVTLHWLEIDLVKVELKVTIFLYFEKPSTFSYITWLFDGDPKNPKCELICYDGRNPYSLDDESWNLLIDRLTMMIKHFPQALRKLILEPLKGLKKEVEPKEEANVQPVKAISNGSLNGAKKNLAKNGNGYKPAKKMPKKIASAKLS